MINKELHLPVLFKEVVDNLNLRRGGKYIDTTFGRGGHSREILRRIRPSGELIVMDMDDEAILFCKNEFGLDVNCLQGNFATLLNELSLTRENSFDGILMDVGFSSPQVDDSGRGFSFLKDEPLLMTYDKSSIPAYELIKNWNEEELADVIYNYGEERYSRRIANSIKKYEKEKGVIMSSSLLSKVVSDALPSNYENRRIHKATRTFQAIRIATNDELNNLRKAMNYSIKLLKSGGRLVVVDFHSLEDRIVKNFFRNLEKEGFGRNLYKKPVIASSLEIKNNPRSRSAKMRVFEKK